MIQSKNRRSFMLIIAFVFIACANPNIIKITPDTYRFYKQDKTGIAGNTATLTADAIQEANVFAKSKGKITLPLAVTEIPLTPGRFVSFEYKFRLVPPEDYQNVITRTNKLAQSYETTGQHSKAEPLYVQALEIRKKFQGNEHPEVAADMNNLALFHFKSSRYSQAEPLFRQALEIRKKIHGKEHPEVATTMNNLALLYFEMGRYKQAEPLFKQALEIRKKIHGKEHTNVATIMNNLALLYKKLARYDQAESSYRQALTIYEKNHGKHHTHVASTMSNLAALLRTTGRYSKAESLYKKALAIYKKIHGKEHPEVATTMNNLALLYFKMDRYGKAESLYKKALAIHTKIHGKDHQKVATIMNNLAALYEKKGSNSKAEPLYEKALAIYKKIHGEDHPDIATSLTNMAALYESRGQLAGAEIYLKSALRIAEQSNEPELLQHIQAGLSRVFATRRKIDAAIFFGKLAVNTIQQMRLSVASLKKETQNKYLLTKETTYKSLAELLISQGRHAEASQVLAMLKEEEYFDFIRRDSKSESRQSRVHYIAEEKTWKNKYDKISDRLAALGQEVGQLKQKHKMGDLTVEEKERLYTLEFDVLPIAKKEFNRCVDELIQDSLNINPERKKELLARNLDSLTGLQSTLRNLDHGAVLLHFVMMKKKLRILLTTPYIQIAREYPICEKVLNQKIFYFRDTMAFPMKDPLPLAKELYGYLLTPVIKDLRQAKAKTLMVSLDGALRYIPIAALHDGKRYLTEEFQLAMFTEAAKDKLKDKASTKWRVAGLGLTKAVSGFCAMPAVKDELEGIIRVNASDKDGVLAGTVCLDEKFTIRALQDALIEAFPVLHIASHFNFSPGNETRSCLILGDGTRLSLAEIRNTYDFPNVDLLTLSACNTAMGSNARGQEIEGFGAMAQNRGAKGVIATLWPVADRSTGLFMKTMYALRTNEGLTKAKALQKAQIKFIKGFADWEKKGSKKKRIGYSTGEDCSSPADENQKPISYSHPYYWAPFILMGNWL